MIAIFRIRYRNYTHYTSYSSYLPIYGIAIIRLLSFLLLGDLEETTKTSVAIKSGSRVQYIWIRIAEYCDFLLVPSM